MDATTTSMDLDDPVVALRQMEDVEAILFEQAKNKSLLVYTFGFGMPVVVLSASSVPDLVDDPSILATLPWAPYYWLVFSGVVLYFVGMAVLLRRERRRKELDDRRKRLAPIVVRGVVEGSVRRLDGRQAEMLAGVVGDKALREALQASPAFSG